MLGLPVWAGVVVLLVALTVIEVAVWRLVLMPRVRARVEEARTQATLALGGDIVLGGTATHLGLESGGRRQLRGTGYLAVGRDDLVFVMAAPHRVTRIARERISAVDTARRHLGRATGRARLRVCFTGEDGAPDAVAFDVGAATAPWQEALSTG